MTTLTQSLSRYPLLLFAASLLLSLASAMLVGALLLNLPRGEISELALLLAGIGLATMLASYALYRTGAVQRFHSVRWTILLVILYTIAMVLFIVWVAAELMFIDRHYVTLTGTMLVFAGLSAAGFGIFISRAITERLDALTGAAERLATGDLSTRIALDGQDEIARLAATLNSMAAGLEAADQQKREVEAARRDFVAWVSHDLRTPLASMRVMIEAMADGVVTDEATTTRYLRNTQLEIEHMAGLIDDLFDLSQIDMARLALDKQDTCVSDLISDTVGAMAPKAARRGIALRGDVAPEVSMVPAAPDKLQRILNNLIDNAIQYTPAGEAVTVRAVRTPGQVRIDVHNSGVTIAPEALPHLFDSFYRGEASRAATAEGDRGAGLGLAIARGLVEAHGGRIWVSSAPGQGTCFSFTLPAGASAASGL
jgi:signal transduction histidine kinase